MALIVNLFGGPGVGKSTIASGIFCLLKMHDIKCEYVTEFAKDLTWEDRTKTLENQQYVFAKQFHRLWRLDKQVDIIITDAPLLLSLYYHKDKTSNLFKQYVKETHNSFENINYYIEKSSEANYSTSGRSQTKSEADCIGKEIKAILDALGSFYEVLQCEGPTPINSITQSILNSQQCPMKFKVN